jgi:hypothetical protein
VKIGILLFIYFVIVMFLTAAGRQQGGSREAAGR